MPVGPIWILVAALIACGMFLPIYGYKLLKKDPIKGKLMLGVGIAIALFIAFVFIRG